ARSCLHCTVQAASLLTQSRTRSDPLGQNRESHFSAAPGDSRSGGAFQIFTVPSRLAEASHSPSWLKATLSTQSVWPSNTSISSVAESQPFPVESLPPQARRRPSGLKATLITAAEGFGIVFTSFQIVVSQIFTERSIPAEANCLPSLRNATVRA